MLGRGLAEALGDKAGIRRFASIALPLDEALVEVALDLSGRPFLAYDVDLRGPTPPRSGRPRSTRSWPRSSGGPSSPRRAITLHVRLVTGKNTHHMLEASFKGVARCLRDARARRGRGRALDQGHAGRADGADRGRGIAVLDYGIGNLRLGPEGARAPRGGRRRLVTDPRRRRGRRRCGAARGGRLRPLRRGAARAPASTRAVKDALSAGCRSSASASGSSCSTRAPRSRPGVPGLGVLPGVVRRCRDGVKRPADAVEPAADAERRPTVGS